MQTIKTPAWIYRERVETGPRCSGAPAKAAPYKEGGRPRGRAAVGRVWHTAGRPDDIIAVVGSVSVQPPGPAARSTSSVQLAPSPQTPHLLTLSVSLARRGLLLNARSRVIVKFLWLNWRCLVVFTSWDIRPVVSTFFVGYIVGILCFVDFVVEILMPV